MSEPKPSEILRPLLDERGNVKGDSDTYRDKLFAILDRLDAEQRRLAAKVDGPVVKPDLTTEAPKLAEVADGWLDAEAREWAVSVIRPFVNQDGGVLSSTNPYAWRTDLVEAVSSHLTAFAAHALEQKRADCADKEKDRCVYYQDIVYAVCNSLDRINRNIGLMGHIGADTGTVVCGTLDTPSDQVQRLMREVEQRIVNQKMSITHLDHKLAKAESDLDSARTECERLRGLIRDFTESMTKTLGDGLPKGAVR